MTTTMNSKHWYCVDNQGEASMRDSEADARVMAEIYTREYPHRAPYRAVQLVDAAELVALQAERDALLADKALLDWLSQQEGANLVNDDAGRWAVSVGGCQPVPENGGFREAVNIMSFVEPEEWRDDLRHAIDVAMSKESEK